MDIRLIAKITTKNENLYQRRLALGYFSVQSLVNALQQAGVNISYQSYLAIENLRSTPSVKEAEEISRFLNIAIELVFPKMTATVVKRLKKLKLSAERCVNGDALLQSETEKLLIEDRRNAITAAINTLDEREQKLVTRVFLEGKTYEEAGRDFNITRSRVMQIVSRGIRKLRHPKLKLSEVL